MVFGVYSAGFMLTKAPPLSKAGVKSTSLGITLLWTRLYIPQEMSDSVIGGGSANGLFLIWAGNILQCYLLKTIKKLNKCDLRIY